MGVPNPMNNMAPDLGPRSTYDNPNPLMPSARTARYLGSRAPEESLAQMLQKAAQRQDLKFKKKRGDYTKIMVDRIAEGKGIDDLIPQYTKYDGNPETLSKELVDGLMNRQKSWAERYLGDMKGFSGAQKAQRVEQFRLLIKQELETSEEWQKNGE
jgi:hypothetical protein